MLLAYDSIAFPGLVEVGRNAKRKLHDDEGVLHRILLLFLGPGTKMA